MIAIDILLTEQEMVQSFLTELEARRLPEQFFYWFPLSLQAWLDLCSDGAYRNYQRSYNLIAENTAELISPIPVSQIEVISLGAGQGDKDVLILKALAHTGHEVSYKPVDASQGLLEIACRTAVQANIPAQGIKANMTDPDHLQAIAFPRKDGQCRLFLLLGNTLGAFDPANYIATLHSLLAPDDYLLLDGEIFAPAQTIAGYDNPLNRQFAFAPLTSIGLTADDGDLNFEMEEDAGLPGLYRLTKHFRAKRKLAIQLAGRTISMQPEEKIAMNYSGKYSRTCFFDLLRHRGQFQIIRDFTTPDETFVMTLLKPT
jgi:uncharacterized SAM-dependent methyltransferase